MREPHYQRIKRYLLGMIEDGRLRPGDRVPPERELLTLFGVSRMTARQALVDLERDGVITRQQGRGSFVSEPKLEEALAHLTSFTDDMRSRGFQPGAKLLRCALAVAPDHVAGALRLEPGAKVLVVERLRTADGAPLALQTAHLPQWLGLDSAELESGSLYAALGRRGIVPSSARETLEALAANPPDVEVLGVREGAPLLGLTRLTFDPHGRPIEFTVSRYRGDRYRFAVDLAARDLEERGIGLPRGHYDGRAGREDALPGRI